MNNFKELSFEKFRALALDTKLTCYEKIGFPNSYRANKEEAIFRDILTKLTSLSKNDKTILDIGCGCSDLPLMIVNWCETQHHKLLLADSAEMLALLPNKPFISKFSGNYPLSTPQIFENYLGKIDIILCYSVFHYIFDEGNLFQFLDKTLSLLAPGGQFLIGDIPNISKRKRFFSSQAGIKFHQDFTNTDEIPTVNFNCLEYGQIDDAIFFSIIQRCRQAGFDAYLVPQNEELPMANRREDIIIHRP